MKPERHEITRAEWKEMCGIEPNPWSIGATIYVNGQATVEYVFTDEAEQFHSPGINALLDIQELDRIYNL